MRMKIKYFIISNVKIRSYLTFRISRKSVVPFGILVILAALRLRKYDLLDGDEPQKPSASV